MTDELHIKPVAYYKGPFGSKFGIPRQSALANAIKGRIVFTEPYRVQEALRGISNREEQTRYIDAHVRDAVINDGMLPMDNR